MVHFLGVTLRCDSGRFLTVLSISRCKIILRTIVKYGNYKKKYNEPSEQYRINTKFSNLRVKYLSFLVIVKYLVRQIGNCTSVIKIKHFLQVQFFFDVM